MRFPPAFALAALLLLCLCACGSDRVQQVDTSFVERDAAGFATPGRDTSQVHVQGIPGWDLGARGKFSGNATGVAAMFEKDGRRTLVLQGFSSPQGDVYLTKDGKVDNAIRLGATGASSYTVPGIAGIDAYNRVIVVSRSNVVASAGLS